MNITDILAIIFGITTIIGVYLTIRYGQKFSELEKQRKTIHWTDLLISAKELALQMKKEFVPDVIITPGTNGATFVNILKNEISEDIPVLVGMNFSKSEKMTSIKMSDMLLIETSKTISYIPKYIMKFKDKKILIADDFAMSGDFINQMKSYLVKKQFKEENIKIMCIVATKIAIQSNKSPDYYWTISDDSNFYFPWGKAI